MGESVTIQTGSQLYLSLIVDFIIHLFSNIRSHVKLQKGLERLMPFKGSVVRLSCRMLSGIHTENIKEPTVRGSPGAVDI